MTKREELSFFSERANELIDSKYILADIKIVNLLKAIAASDTLLALFKNCLTVFDYYDAKKKYLVKSPLFDDKGEFVKPQSSREFLAFVFTILVDMDAKNIVLGDFLDKYFYEDGSCYSGYASFINAMIKPFKTLVEKLMESVIEGKLQDPVEALTEEEIRKAREKKILDEEEKKSKELSQKKYGASVKKIKEILLSDKKKIKASKTAEEKKKDYLLIVDMFGSVIESLDKDAIEYAFTAYKFMAKAHKIKFFNRIRKLSNLVKDVTDGIWRKNG